MFPLLTLVRRLTRLVSLSDADSRSQPCPARSERTLVRRPSLVSIVLLLGVAVRIRLGVENHSYWYDEAYLLLNVYARSFADLVGAIDYNVAIPPAFLWVERALFLTLGPAEWAMRLEAFVAGLAALFLMVPLARRVVGGPAAWVPVALLAVSRCALAHGCEVRPYTVDLLAVEAVLLAASVLLAGETSGRARTFAGAALLAITAVGPWLSFPIPFALGGGILALFVKAWQGGSRGLWVLGAAVGLTAVLSGGTMWYFHARHLYYPGLQSHWGAGGQQGFPNWSNLWAVAAWPLDRAVNAGNYGTREMGIVLTLLAVAGAYRLGRRNLPVAAAILGSAALAVSAGYLGYYPLAGRTAVFLLPGLWLAAGAGVVELSERFPGRRAVRLVPFAVIAYDLVMAGVSLVTPSAYPPAREMFQYVRSNRTNGDLLWVSHVEVYQCYHGREEWVVGCLTPTAEVMNRSAGSRVWVIEQPSAGMSVAAPVVAALKTAGYAEVDRREGYGIVLVLYARLPVGRG
ncbi:MAG: hypothetical protein JWO38_1707 [Gemmataceae bacterium]|nr:hypothetical protein [Gemmataceae bacterium]